MTLPSAEPDLIADARLDPRSATPLYRQIAQWVEAGIETGRLRPRARLPTVRDLAERLSVAVVTAHQAYALLRERGLVESTVGRGTFVSESAGPSTAAAAHREPEGQDTVSRQDDLRRFELEGGMARAEPDPDLAPAAPFLRLHRELADDPRLLVRYGAVEGERRLREQIANRLADRGIHCPADEVLVTGGSTPALAASVQLLARPGDRVLVEERTYFGFLSLLAASGVEPVPVPMDGDGIDPEALERALMRGRPRFLYTMPTFHNPTGLSMSEGRRRDVLSVAERHGLVLVEDDVFYDLSYDGAAPPPLKAMAPAAEVIYVDSFSKSLLPGLRLGFVVPPSSLRRGLAARLETATLTTSHLLQRTLAEYLERGELERHLECVRPAYRDRRDALMAALAEHMPPGVRWTRPAGGLCCWLSLPQGHYEDLAREAARRDVGFAPGWVFEPQRRALAGLRLCLGAVRRERIDEQVRVLGELVRARLEPTDDEREAVRESVPIV